MVYGNDKFLIRCLKYIASRLRPMPLVMESNVASRFAFSRFCIAAAVPANISEVSHAEPRHAAMCLGPRAHGVFHLCGHLTRKNAR